MIEKKCGFCKQPIPKHRFYCNDICKGKARHIRRYVETSEKVRKKIRKQKIESYHKFRNEYKRMKKILEENRKN